MGGSGPTYQQSRITVFFLSQRAGWEPDLPGQLTRFIDGAERSLACAAYDLRDDAILTALARARTRGIDLRIAFDRGRVGAGPPWVDPKPGSTTDQLDRYGLSDLAVPVHEYRHLMHDKFLVRDRALVWTGSANFTHGSLRLADNNCLVLESPELAAGYEDVFDHLIHLRAPPDGSAPDRRAEIDPSVPPPPLPSPIQIGSASITPIFSPGAGEGIEEVVIGFLNRARVLRVCSFLISDPGILRAFARFADPSLDAKGVYDQNGMADFLRQTHQPAELFWFTRDPRFVGAPSHPYNSGSEEDFMHNKFMVFDNRFVLTGSYNFSESAEENDENVLLIDSPDLAAAYTRYTEALWQTYAGMR